ncbi:MAG: DNA polymerase Y family protein [Pseudomonadota bacterium]
MFDTTFSKDRESGTDRVSTARRGDRMAKRIIVIALPYLAAEHHLRREGLTGLTRPFAIAAQEGGALRLVSLNPAAQAAGLGPGIGVSDARAVCPGLITRPASPERLEAFLGALARWAERFAPIVGRAPDAVALARRQPAQVETGDRGQTRSGGRSRSAEPRGASRPAGQQTKPTTGPHGGTLVLDATGCAHLFGGEGAMLEAIIAGLGGLGLTARAAIADTKGAAWALAEYGLAATPGSAPSARIAIAPAGRTRAAIADLPVAALRLEPSTAEGLAKLGLGRIGEMAGVARAQLARRFGVRTVKRLDQALGAEPEPVAPARAPRPIAARLTLAEPIGLKADVLGGLDRLLESVGTRLEREGRGARALRLTARRVDASDVSCAIRLARPMRDPMRLRALFEPRIDELDAGYGIDALRLEALETEPMRPTQAPGRLGAPAGSAGRASTSGDGAPHAAPHAAARPAVRSAARPADPAGTARARAEALADLLSRIGNRIGFENLTRPLPADSHIPERAFTEAAAAYADPGDWRERRGPTAPRRPLLIFTPEPLTLTAAPPVASPAPPAAAGTRLRPPPRFRWRRRDWQVIAAEGPERLAPEWWWDDPAWASGPRDYWRIATAQGPRLWLFHTPAAASPSLRGWHVHGEFA